MKLTNVQKNEIVRPFGIPENANLLVTDDWGTQLWVFRESNRSVIQFGFQIVSVEGSSKKPVVGEPIFRKREQLLSKNGFNFIYNLDGEFSFDNIAKARLEFQKVQLQMDKLEISDKCSFQDVYQGLFKYADEHREEKDLFTITNDNGCWYANMPTKDVFEKVLEELDTGWKALEVKRMLKRLGLLRVNQNRPYDYAMYDDNGFQYRVISIRLEGWSCNEEEEKKEELEHAN